MSTTAVSITLEDSRIEALCKALGDTENGLTHEEIGQLLKRCGLADPEPKTTKWKRLYAALRDAPHDRVREALHAAMDPALYVGRHDVFDRRRTRLNQTLAFWGVEVQDDGRLHAARPIRTLTEAEERAVRLREALERHGVHPDVLRFCQAELLQDDYFHAVFEATKSVAEKIRQRTGLTSDGNALVDEAFGQKNGRLAFNALRTETERSEHTGLCNLIKGIFGAFRNITAHAPRISWRIDEADALDLLTLASLLHRRIDAAAVRRADE
ncbi:MAG TPA: TIGR02391 family protein [Longimicrobiales bacterium]